MLSKKLYGIILAASSLLMLAGCGSKQYVIPELPQAEAVKKTFNTPAARISQSFCDEHDIETSLNGAPPNLLATTINIENKTDKPLTVEIERTNVSTYTSEDLALMFSKIAIQHPEKQALVLNHDVLRATIIAFTILASYVAGVSMYRITTVFSPYSERTNNIIRGGIASLVATLVAALGGYGYSAVMAERENILESEEEHLIEQLQQLFESAVLSFEDCIEIAPHSTLEQTIFYDATQAIADGDMQRELVLRLEHGAERTIVPLEI